MAIAFRSASQASNAASTSINILAPTGLQNNDVMLAILDFNNSPTITAPVGWNLLNSVNTGVTAVCQTYYKVASSEGSSFVWTCSTSQRNAGAIACFSGVSTSTPIDTNVAASDGTVNITIVPSTNLSLTTANNNEMVVGLITEDDAVARTFIEPSGFTEAIDTNTPSGCEIAYQLFTNASSTTGSIKWTMSSTGATTAAFLVALIPSVIVTVSSIGIMNLKTGWWGDI